MITGPDIRRDNLTFGFIADERSRFYLGEPTTNVAPSQQMAIHGSYGTVATFSDAPERGEDWKKVIITHKGTNFRITQMPYYTQAANDTFTYSIEMDWNNTTGYYIAGDGSRGFSCTDNTGTNPYGTFSYTSSGNEALFIYNQTYDTDCSDIIYYRYYQIEEKLHPTTYTPTSRTDTESLLDIVGDIPIDLTTMLYDNGSYPLYKGQGEQTTSKTNVVLLEVKCSVSLWFCATSLDNSSYLIYSRSGKPESYNLFYLYATNHGEIGMHRGNSASEMIVLDSSLDKNIWINIVWQWNGDGAQSLYQNGVELYNEETSFEPVTKPFDATLILSDTKYSGYINHILVYNTELTQAQILHNYNKVKLISKAWPTS